ncbi:hypothetical protein GE21DRAFT_1313814 [Neurospora crassa]|nr:hypothetical protein GE21DRAFT_1313814 [Neurospora crassa]
MGHGEGKGNTVDDNMFFFMTTLVGYAGSHDMELGLEQGCCFWSRRRGEAQGEGRGGYPWESL